MREAVKVGILLPSLVLVAAGCATKGFVRETVTQKEVEIDQKIGQVDSRLKAETQRLDQTSQQVGKVEGVVTEQAQRIEGMGFRVQKMEGSLADTAQLAKGAQERADAAMTRADSVDTRLTKLWNSRGARNLVESLDVQFPFARAELTDSAQTALLGLVKELRENPRLSVELLGYTDPRGSREYNYQLSQRRVEAVRRYLVGNGVDLPRIQHVGLGPLEERGVPDAQKRRVTVKLMMDQE
ncbi:MAG: OmpA family protein [Candidatus Rokubacteria bacterium]|nr:OmpA family protein [Candidatus Rokubacteria bacterium]